MRLLTLTVNNFGIFRGCHSFELAPLPENGQSRHLTVFCGHNGAGKTTLFQAILLALHGQLALGDRVSRQHYNDFLLSRLHQHSVEGDLVLSENAGVSISFQYIQSGRPLHIQVERGWQYDGANVHETLSVLRDGNAPDVAPSDNQIWLNDLIPPGLAQICFFDAEQLKTLASASDQNEQLRILIERLLGLDLIRRLQSDLELYTSRQGGARAAAILHETVRSRQSRVDELQGQVAQLEQDAAGLKAQHENIEAALARQQQYLAAEGGSYAARRQVSQERLAVVKQEIKAAANEMRDLSADLLPFALVPELCHKLNQQLEREAEAHRYLLVGELWDQQLEHVDAALAGEDFWHDLNLPSSDRDNLTQRLIALLHANRSLIALEEAPIHRLAEPDQRRLQSWIDQATKAVPQQVRSLGERLRQLQVEQQKIETDLQRAPDDAVLAPVHDDILRLQTAMTEVERNLARLMDKLGQAKVQLDDQIRQLRRTIEEFEATRANEQQVGLAERSKLVMRAFRDALMHQQVGTLEEALVQSFNVVCRKDHLLVKARIDLETFNVDLEGADNRAFSLDDFSAGERQLYIMAMLWALRQVSGRQLPLAIDTPLARLDERHRQGLTQSFFPSVSDQVLLFMTDAELHDGELLAEVEPYLARVYWLNYDSEHQGTTVRRESRIVPIDSSEVALGV